MVRDWFGVKNWPLVAKFLKVATFIEEKLSKKGFGIFSFFLSLWRKKLETKTQVLVLAWHFFSVFKILFCDQLWKKNPTPKIQSQIKSGRAIAYQNPASQEILSIFWYGFCFRFTFLLLVSPANWKIKLWSAKTDFYVLWPHFMENTESKGSFTYAFCYWMDFHLVWRYVNFLLEMTAFYPTLWNGQ